MIKPAFPMERPRFWPAVFRLVLRIALIFLIVLAVHSMMSWAMEQTDRLEGTARGTAVAGILLLSLLAYVVLLAVPFVPGVEIGVSLMLIQGPQIVPFVYLATVLGLCLAFLAGRYLPLIWLHTTFRDLHMKSACHLMDKLASLNPEQRLALLRSRVPGRLGALAVRYRYIAFGLLLNVPGNSVIGGGGGIATIAGVSKLFGPVATGATIALATLPIPLGVWIFGTEYLSTN